MREGLGIIVQPMNRGTGFATKMSGKSLTPAYETSHDDPEPRTRSLALPCAWRAAARSPMAGDVDGKKARPYMRDLHERIVFNDWAQDDALGFLWYRSYP
jgi:hypothetical protein